MSIIARNISNYLAKHKMPIARLEKNAGLNRNSIHSLVSGVISHPRIDTLLAVTDAMDCSIYDLTEDSPSTIDNLDLLESTCKELIKSLRQSDRSVSSHTFNKLLMQAYHYSLKENKSSADIGFIRGLLSADNKKAA